MLDREYLQEREQFALKLSIVGTVFMAALGFGFAYLTNSDAVMLDGVFSLVGFTMSVLTLYVSRIVIRPDDEVFHFGYAHFEPLLNVFKSLIILTICVVALVAAIDAILAGGRELIIAPPAATTEAIERQLTEAARAFEFKDLVVRIQKFGRETYVNVHIILDRDYPIVTINTLDEIRAALDSKMKAYDPQIVIDAVFIGDYRWAGLDAQQQ